MYYIVAVVSLLFCTAILARDTNCNANGLTLTSSVAGRHACLSEVVTFTCTARGHVIFWGNEEFGEITVHYRSPPSGGEFQAAVESYENNCLVSTLTLRATASRNRTRVVCTNRGRTSNQSKSLHIMNITLDHLTVVPVSLSSVQLEWEVIPTDGHHCITGYNVRVSGQNESQISGGNKSFLLCGVQLEPSKEYTYSVTANISSTQTGPSVEQTSIVEVQEPNPPTNLSATMTCGSQGYQVYIEWKVPLPAPLCSPLSGYLLHFHIDDTKSAIHLPLNTTSYMLGNVTGCAYNITVAALSHTGPSRNNPSVRLAIPCEDSLVTAGHYSGTPSIFTRVLTAVEDTGVESSCMATPQRCSDCTEPPSIPFSNQTDCTDSIPSVTLYTITAVISGVISFCSGILFASVCNCILQCHKQWRVNRKSSECTIGVATQQRGGSPYYEEISTPESGSQSDMQLQQNAAYLAVQSSH